MTIIEIIFSTPSSEGDYDSRVVECDEWHWGARLDVRREGRLVAQFEAAAVLGVVDLSATAEIDEDDLDDVLDDDIDEDEGEDDEDTADAPAAPASAG